VTEKQSTAAAGDTSGRPARPAGYWERIDALVQAAPPLTNLQRARIRAAIHRPTDRREAA
jgi:hypothetical protein